MKMVRKLLGVLIAVVLVMPVGQAFAADQAKEITVSYAPLHFIVDGTEYAPPADQQGFIYDSSTYVPLRFVGNVLYHSVDWDAKLQKVSIGAPDPDVDKLLVDLLVSADPVIKPVDKSKIVSKKVKAYPTNVTYSFNGEVVAPPANMTAYTIDGRIYVPLRFVYTSLGYPPAWDAATYSITATSTEEQAAYKQTIQFLKRTLEEIYTQAEDYIWDEINAVGGLQPIIAGKLTEEQKANLYEKGMSYLNYGMEWINDELNMKEDSLAASGQSTAVIDRYRAYYDAKAKFYIDLADKNLKPADASK